MISKEEILEFKNILANNTNFIITTHINPDGDGLGSELAVLRILENLGKNAIIINDSPTPSFYKFLDPDNKRIHYYNPDCDERIESSDVIIIVDISVIERLGRMKDVVKRGRGISVCIDHHISNNGWNNHNFIDENASASGEIVYDFIRNMGIDIDEEISLYLYVAILTDTGSFRFSNTTPRTHEICGELLKKGINPREIYRKVYESYSWERMLLFSRSLSTIKKIAGGRVSSMHVTREMMESINAKMEDIEGFVEYLMTVKDIEIAVLFLELPNNKVKVSFRSKNEYDVNKLAGQFGGGGHKNASGILLENYTIEQAEGEILKSVGEIF